MTRAHALANLRIAGYHDDSKTFTRLYVENRVSITSARQAFEEGQRLKKAGVPCGCFDCSKGKAS